LQEFYYKNISKEVITFYFVLLLDAYTKGGKKQKMPHIVWQYPQRSRYDTMRILPLLDLMSILQKFDEYFL
jgi:hypothetical protein